MKWKTSKLVDLSVLITKGTTPSNVGESFTDKGIPYIRSELLTSEKYISDSGLLFISEGTHKKLKRSQLMAGDILFSMAGAYLGKTAILRERDVPANTNQAVALIRLNSQLCYPDYVYYYLNLSSVVEFVNKINGQSAQPNINLHQIGMLDIILPPIDEQCRIADILSAYDDLIENNQKQIKLLEEAAQRLYKEWFIDLHFPGHETTPIIDGVPEGWNIATVEEIAQVLRRGISPKYNEDAKIMVINQKCIRQTVVNYEEARMQEKAYPPELALQDGDTVICSTGAGTLGRVGQIFGKVKNTTLDSHVTLVRAKDGIGEQLLFWAIKVHQEYLMNAGKGSTNQLELSRKAIGSCKVLLPSSEYSEQFEKCTQAIHDKIAACVQKIKYLQQARDCLLPKLMNGKLEE